MKRITNYLFLLLAGSLIFLYSCKDEDDPKPAPTVTAPTTILEIENAGAGTVTFTVSVAEGLTATYTATGVNVTLGSASGSISGANVDIPFTAGTTTGAASVTLTVTDSEGKSNIATAVIAVDAPETEVVVTSNISTNTTWTSDKVWILGGRVTVLSGVTLTIEAGTIIKGQAGTGSNATALLIARGGKLMAEGTADAPIIFTSVADEIEPSDVAAGNVASPNLDPDVNGLWGGLLVLGKARISATNKDTKEDVTEIQIEGIPTSDPNGLYGGVDDADDSGVLKYISIRHGGSLIGSGNEINGLTLGGVGSATVIENIEVVANQDDGIEWFGGTVSVSNVVIWNSFDDGLDTDQAWNGTCSNFIIITPRDGGHGFELDGPEGSYKNGNHKFMNGTVYAGPDIDQLIDFDENTNVDMENIYFYGVTTATTVTEYKKMFDAGNGTVASFEYSDIANPAAVFVDIPAEKYAAVNTNENTVGVKNQTGFEWTWASQSGKLTEIGL